MVFSVFGQVIGVRKYVNGNIEIDFYHEDEIIKYKYSSNSSLDSNFSKVIAETLASTLTSDICVEIHFDDNSNFTHIELEECDYDD